MILHEEENIITKGYEFTGVTLTDPSYNQMNRAIPEKLNVMPSEITALRIAPNVWKVYYIPNANKEKKYQALPILPFKSEPCSAVLKLMDNDFSYEQSVKIALVLYRTKKAELENELNLYI